VPAFRIEAIDPNEDMDLFREIWDTLEPGSDLAKVAYKVSQGAGELLVYYSTAFTAYKEQIEKLKYQASLASSFAQNYEIWIGYHAIMQWQQRSTIPDLARLDEEQLDRLQEHERAVVASMQVKQALKMAELQALAVKGRSE
jgi:hypothetical protein